MKTPITNRALAVALAGVLGGGIAAPQAAFAAAEAYSTLNITNFQVFDGTGTQYQPGDLDDLRVNNETTARASLDGVGITGSDSSDVSLQCLGNCAGIGENDFSNLASGTEFSRGDSLLEGSVLDDPATAAAESSHAEMVAETQVYGDTSGNSGSEVFTDSRFSFVLGEDDILDLRFDASYFTERFLDGGLISRTNITHSITIEDTAGNSVFTWAPDGGAGGITGGTEVADPFDLNTEVARFDPGTGTDSDSGAFRATTNTLSAGTSYIFSVSSAANVRAASVPTPATLGLLGLGLVGLGFVGSRTGRRNSPLTAA